MRMVAPYAHFGNDRRNQKSVIRTMTVDLLDLSPETCLQVQWSSFTHEQNHITMRRSPATAVYL